MEPEPADVGAARDESRRRDGNGEGDEDVAQSDDDEALEDEEDDMPPAPREVYAANSTVHVHRVCVCAYLYTHSYT